MRKLFCKFLFSVLILFSYNSMFSLDLSDTSGTLADSFESFSDDNAGSTTFRSLNITTGGRLESLGTAGVGLCDDISFFDYNPSASSILDETELAVFHNSWIADSAIESIAFTTRNSNLGYGFQLKCFYVPFSEYNLFGERVAGSYYSETSVTANVSYNFLAGYKFKGISLGANLRTAWRNMPDYTDNKTNEIIEGSGLEQSALAFMTDLGMLLRFNFLKGFSDRNPNLKIGIAFSNIGIALTGFGNQVQLDDSLPTRFSAGLSYRIFAPILFTCEFRQPVNLLDFSSSEIWSSCAGLEISVTKAFDFDMGFLLQGANPRISMGSGFLIKSIKMNVNYTFDLTSSQNPVNHISLSAKLKFGDKGRKLLQEQIDKYYIEGLKLYSEGDLDSAITQWDMALELDKRFDPAIDAKNIAIRFKNVKSNIMNMQKFDITSESK